MILSTLDKSRKGGAYEQIPSLVLGQRWTPQLNSRNMMKVVLCVWIEPYIENDLSFCVWPVHTPTTSKEVLTLSASTSPLPYTGNKSCIVNTILSVMPKHTVYIDPCMGSAEVFFRKPRAEKEILNDYNGDLVNLFRVIQNNEKLAYLLGRLYLSINGELAFKQNKDRLKGVPNILDDVIETSQIFYDASWEDIQNAAAFLENQVYSFSSTGQTFGIARRDMSQRLPRLMSAYNRIRDAIILHRDYKDVITYAACPGSFILQQLRAMPNVVMLLGNHEYMMLDALYNIPDEEDGYADYLREKRLNLWYRNGGDVTHRYLKHIRKSVRQEILEYLDKLPVNIEIMVNGQKYLLTHAAPEDEYLNSSMKHRDGREFAVWHRYRSHDRGPDDYTVIFGHTPTTEHQLAKPATIWNGRNLIDIDCGAAYEEIDVWGIVIKTRLACLRLDDMKEFYSEEDLNEEGNQRR